MIKTAIIPAAGRGLRLDRPGTPKPLVDVDGQPMIFRLMRQLKDAGVKKIVVVIGFGAEKVEREVKRHVDLADGVVLVRCDDWEAGLSNSILAARSQVDGPFILAMSDHIFDDALIQQAAAESISESKEDGTTKLFVFPHLEQVFDVESAVKAKLVGDKIEVLRKDAVAYDAVDMGLFVMAPWIFDYLEEQRHNGELSDALSQMAASGKLIGVSTSFEYDDVDTPSALVHAEMRLRRQRRSSRISVADMKPRHSAVATFNYEIDKPLLTKIVVGRGFVKDPSTLDLIGPQSASSPIFVFTDEIVAELYGYDFKQSLHALGYDVHLIVLPVGEESKSLTNYAFLVERVLRKGVDEQSVFISLGGGVVCNVCGFVASTIYRGLNLIHLPTTLMAQCDAAVSHKQGINGYQGKNMVGSYYSPQLVAIDVETLNTLPDRLVADGVSEIIKHALGQDKSYVEMMLAHSGDLRDLDFIEETIRRNVALKCELVASDPKEFREGMVLQYGHTVGHPIEHLSGYSYYHGEAVAIGMSVAARVSRIMGGCDAELVELHDALNVKFQLPCRIPASIRTDDILVAMKYNKRFLTEGTRMALLSGVGELWCVDDDYAIPVSESTLREAINQCRDKGE